MGNTSSSANKATPSSSSHLSSETPHRSSSRRSRQPTASTAQQPHRDAPPVPAQADKHRSPSRTPADAQSRAGDAQQKPSRLPHRSLRQKKKSLELPDLALALSPATGLAPGQTGAGTAGGNTVPGPYRRPQASSPIAIPTVRGPNGVPIRTNTDRPKTIAAASTDVVAQLVEFELAQQQQALDDINSAQQQTRGQNPHFPGAPLQYSSTRSFTGASREQPMQSFALRDHPYVGFVPEDVRSSIPLALRKAESGTQEDEEKVEGRATQAAGRASVEEQKQPVQVPIVWKAGGKIVELIRAGDNKWKGRQPMDYDEATKQWSACVSLLPGTHHLRFLVDGQPAISDDLPTAVDDDGALANYVAVAISGHTPTPTTQQPPHELCPPSTSTSTSGTGNGNSFFADVGTGSGANEPGEWTDRVPWQLECAAEEEEQWLAHPQSHAQQPPPQHPQAPSLPRHLEKLIMNQRPPSHRTSSATTSRSPASSSAALFGGALPVTTASGTNLSASTSGGQKTPGGSAPQKYNAREMYTKLNDAPSGAVAGPGLADDGSVLPVPSHVVLHHLGTSAIRNGVLAVADTTRYRGKFITTVYYKPT